MYDFKSLEFDEFIFLLKETFSSKFSIEATSYIKPLSDISEISRVQNEINEAIELSKNGKLIENDDEFFSLYNKLRNESFSLEPLEFIILKNFLLKVEKLKVLLLSKKPNYLKNKIENINTLSNLSNQIIKSISDKGEIKDDASIQLYGIRKQLNDCKTRIKHSLNNIINSSTSDKFVQEKVIIERNGRYTIPCKTNFSQYIQGIIHDKSFSGQTLYIEPTSCVSINNDMQELYIKESEEIAKIIYNLMEELNNSLDDIDLLIENYKYISLQLEIGYFYIDKKYTFGEIDNYISLQNIHHPLLYIYKGEKSIPVDINIDKDILNVIVTGPNTGGKTAALKSLGLNHLITYCGLPVFATSAKFKLYNSILADIGDKQSLTMDLSTFSSHILNIKNIINDVDSNSLVLFDELGTGTEPREGACLAISILDYLQNKKATTVVTTHFSEVKNYALNNPYSLFYSVDFDYDTFIPKFRLLKDVIGKSDPILIAKKLGFNNEIINNAENQLIQYKSTIEMNVEELNKLIAENKRFQRLLEDKEKELQDKENELNNTEKSLQEKLNSKELDLLEEAYSLLQKGKRLANEKLRINVNDIDKDITNISKKINKLKIERKHIKDILVGDLIFLERYNKSAKVLSVEGEYVNLNMEGMRVKIKKSDAIGKKIDKNINQQVNITSKTNSNSSKRELLLIGKRVEEAIDMLDKFLDESILSNYDLVYIIHGRGSGQLRKAIHEELRKNKRIKSYSLAENNDGGNAVTIVRF